MGADSTLVQGAYRAARRHDSGFNKAIDKFIAAAQPKQKEGEEGLSTEDQWIACLLYTSPSPRDS